MRTLIFSVVLMAAAAAGFYTFVSASIAASREAKPATFSERFDAVPSYKGPLDRKVLLEHYSSEQR
jgi:hypothetical protein